MVIKARTSLPSKTKEAELRLGQKFGIMGDDPLNYTLVPPEKPVAKSSEGEEDIMATLQKIYDLVEAEPGLSRDLKDKIARLLARFHHQEEPGFTADEAYKLIIRDYQMVRDIPERSLSSKPAKQRSTRKSQKKMPVKQQPAPLSPAAGQSSAGKAPTMTEIMEGRPFSPADFAIHTASQNSRRQTPPRRNLPAVMPTAQRRPPMAGAMSGPWRRGMGMGFPMNAVRPGSGFYGRPW